MAAPRFESQVALECSCLRCAGGARQRGRARRPQTRLGQCGAARGTSLTDADLAGRSPAKPGPGWTSALSLLKTVVRPGLKFLVESGFAPVYVRHISNSATPKVRENQSFYFRVNYASHNAMQPNR